jgi:hypothetical protein
MFVTALATSPSNSVTTFAVEQCHRQFDLCHEYQRNRGSSATREEAMADFKARWLADIN